MVLGLALAVIVSSAYRGESMRVDLGLLVFMIGALTRKEIVIRCKPD